VRHTLEGSRDAFGTLVLRHSTLVRAICVARIGTGDADDAVQEVFLRAFRGLRRLQDPGSFPAYLGQIARNFCIDRLRTASGKRGQLSLDEVDLELSDAIPPSNDDKELLLERLRREVGRLPENQREVLLLFYFERMSYADMAAALGVTEAAVNQRLSRARQQLRSAFARIPEAQS
jgi:RNA polymerase sigma factor (sigma-70 family)